MDNESLIKLSGTESILGVINGSFTIEQLVLAHLERIEFRNDQVLAWAYLNKDIVIAEAKRMDQIPISERGLLHGLLVGIKDIIQTADFPTLYGSPLMKLLGSFPTTDASVVSILRSNGALIFGKTTTVEFAAYRTISPTRNPHNFSKTPGGSSSGSAASVADFQIPFALGTQTAGSVQRPASFCGVIGYKPTWGTVGLDGVKIFSASNDCLGFFSRTVADQILISSIFKLPISDLPLPNFNSQPLRIAIYHTPAWISASSSTVNALELTESILFKSGAIVTHITLPPQFDNILQLHRTIMAGEAKANFRAPHLLSLKQSQSLESSPNPPLIHQDLVNYVNNFDNISNTTLLKAYDEVASLRTQFDTIVSQYDAILSPSAMGEAPDFETTGDPRFNSMFTILHSCVISLPSPKRKGELPVGISLAGARFGDELLLQVAEKVEALFVDYSSSL